MFLRICFETSALLQNNLGCDTFCSFLRNKSCWACLLGSGLKLKSSLRSFAETLISWTTEKRDVPSDNSLTIKIKQSGKSFT